MNKLTKEALIDILKNKEGSIASYYKETFEKRGIDIEYTDCFFEKVVDISYSQGLNARGFRSTFYLALEDLIFSEFNENENERKKIILDKSFINKHNLRLL